MALVDRLALVTPEGVALDIPLAGVGSRLYATVIDLAIQALAWVAVGVPAIAIAGESGVVRAFVAIWVFVVLFFYHVVFETTVGRSPGKQIAGLRVVLANGGPVHVRASMIRNLIRLIDMQLGGLVGMTSIVLTSSNQRLGDIAAGTFVISDPTRMRRRYFRRPPTPPFTRTLPGFEPTAAPHTSVSTRTSWDVSGIEPADIGAVRTYLARRASLPEPQRIKIAAQFATNLRPRVAGASASLSDDEFLEALVRESDARS